MDNIKQTFKEKEKVEKQIQIFKQNLLQDIAQQKKEFLDNKDKEAVKLLEDIEEKIEHKEDTLIQQKIYNPLIGAKFLIDIALIVYFNIIKQNKKEEIKNFISKIKDINENKEIYEQIKDDLSKVLNAEEIAKLIINSNKNIKELRELVNNLKNSVEEAKSKQLKEELLKEVKNNLQPEVLKIINKKDEAAFAIINYLSTIEENELNKKQIEQAFNDILSKEEINNIIKNKEILFEKLEEIDELNYNLEMNNDNYESAGSDSYLIETIEKLTNEITKIANLDLTNIATLTQQSNLDKAIRAASIFDFQYEEFNKDNVILARDFINKTFNTNLDLNDLKNIQKLDKKLITGKLQDIDFSSLTLNKQIIKNLVKEKNIDIEIER